MSSGLMGGEKTRSAFTKHDGIGTRRGGTIVEPFPFRAQQTDYDTGDLLWWDKEETQPKEQIVVTVQTTERGVPDEDGIPDNGRRRFYIAGGDLQKKTQVAVRQAGGSDFEIGATYFVTRTGHGTPRKNAAGKDLNPPWLYEVEYARPRPGSGLNDGGEGGNKSKSTVLDRSRDRQQAAKDDEPPF